MTSTRAFVFPGIRSRVVFGSGTLAQLAPEMDRLGRKRALLLATPQQRKDVDALADRLGSATAGVFAGAVMHTPVDVTREAIAAFEQSRADCVIALGGGSSIGLGKAIALRTGADQIAVPTTYAGSEMTDILGETKDGEKTTRRDPAILPETVIYDVDLSLTLPKEMTVSSGLNAIAHAAEALYAADRNPILSLMAADAIRAFASALPAVVANPSDKPARADALYGAWLCGAVLGGASMALHHKLCHTLGGSFDTPHAQTHAILLPHTVGFNAAAVGDLLKPISDALGGAAPGKALHRFASQLGAPTRLRDLGLTEPDLDRAAAIAVRSPYANPRPFGQAEIRALLQDAWAGTEPPL
ncbi:maleylacetate reductase [Bradyrhizobium sp. SSBR45G]|uniref:maleylacetate reductase n=1 Tax=unclassified Bradyrhizobium TaxID=2631580 RepID=UPI00234295ED|nr:MULTISPECIES: maleylacetate reductase [unclassified Bradyrhizobium]GLH79063.1 maleylacetate reductase [Bradyrhizobium sp. SSBR45G]GLH86614.1 maleylacetate reductase [Bradyrhizobium sp. SSBR45R]